MELNVNDSRLLNEPTRDTVLAIISELGAGEFAILIRDDDYFVQTRCNDDETWSLEYRDGSAEKHFGADPENTTRENARTVFAAFFDGSNIASLLPWGFADLSATEPEEGEVEYNGIIMDAEWPAQIEAAQGITSVSIAGLLYERVPFGSERNMQTKGLANCGDCGTLPQQLHVPDCDVEQCPKCFQQWLSCNCQR